MKNDVHFLSRPAFILSLFLTLLLPSFARAATLTVAQDGTGQYSAIQPAIDAAQSGDTVLIAPGTYSGDGNRDLDFKGKNITVASESGPAVTVINCGGLAPGRLTNAVLHRGFYIHSGETAAVISGLTITHGYEIRASQSDPTVGAGGGICIINSSVAIQNCTITGNTSADFGGGGGIYNGARAGNTITLANCTITGNSALETAGGVYNSTGIPGDLSGAASGTTTNITITNCTISGNTAGDATRGEAGQGGGVVNANGDLYGTSSIKMIGCTVSGNTATTISGGSGANGGGLYTENIGNLNSITLTDCAFTGNSAQEGGGIYTYNGGKGLTLTNCVIAKNTAQGNGGGFYNNASGNGSNNNNIVLTNCTFSGNSAGGSGGGLYNLNSGFTSFNMTNCIAYADTGAADTSGASEVVNSTPNLGSFSVSYSDIQGGYTGTGNSNADPLFVSAPDDLRLKPGSPAIGAGTSSGAPSTDQDGKTRSNPPTLGAYEAAEAVHSHLLWNHTTGMASVWSVNADGSYTYHLYGPYPGWTASSLAEGPNGQPRLLWTHAGGIASLWNLADPHPDQTYLIYGPFEGWSAVGLSIGADNSPHLLWTHPSGLASVWSADSDGTYSYQVYGPYDGWSATAIAEGPNSQVRLLWTHSGGLASLWNLSDAHPDQSYHLYGPYDGWSAVGLSVGADNLAHLLWTHTSGLASAWNIAADGTFTYQVYGSDAGWSAVGISTDASGSTHLLWTPSGGLARLWNLSDPHPEQTYSLYGPFDGWSAISLNAGP